jgi:UDP-glucose 4-epimerase
MKVLVTGGAGYIGSHFVKYLIQNGKDVVVFDNLSRGHIEAIHPKAEFENVDLLDSAKLSSVLKNYDIDACVHFAAFAYVGESVEKPDIYYTNNVVGSLNLIKALTDANVRKFVFSSTCSVYGNDVKIPISESQPTNPINPYAQTKLIIEKILADFENAYGLKYAALRYFNAAGADEEGELGESHDPEPHLIPLVLQTALGKRDKIFIFGNDYPTPDGTCIRDYIHIQDLADAHLRALDYLESEKKSLIVNLGTGEGYSVKEIIEEAKKITGKEIPAEITARRPGDPPMLVADNSKAEKILGWKPKRKINEIITTAWKWHQNPKF